MKPLTAMGRSELLAELVYARRVVSAAREYAAAKSRRRGGLRPRYRAESYAQVAARRALLDVLDEGPKESS